MRSKIEEYVIDRVRQIRQEKGVSQAQLAYEMDKSQGFIAQIESSRYDRCYNIDHLNEIAIILECSPKDFFPTQPIPQTNKKSNQ